MSVPQKKWVRVTSCQNIPAREGRCVEVAGRQIAIFHSHDGFFAVENRCPHRGGPLADGIINGATVVCPLHTWKFDLTSGASTNHPESGASLTVFRTRVEGGIVCIELPLESETPETATIACEHRDRPIRWVQRKPLSPPQSMADNTDGIRG
jgi:nitrite reductase (NADH) small subunit